MINNFFNSALAAAQQSPEAFALEFKKAVANANATEYYSKLVGEYGEPPIDSIIKDIPDTKLPPLLAILVQHGVDLERRDTFGYTPLALAAMQYKKDTVNFLIHNKAKINDSKKPALCTAINNIYRDSELVIIEIIETLLKAGANINIKDEFSQSPLVHAAENQYFEVMRYLLSQGANLFLKYTYANETQYQTAVGVAYEKYISSIKYDGSNSSAKKCLDLLVQAITDYLYRQGFNEINEELFLTNSINELAGQFRSYIYPEANSNALKKFLEDRIKPDTLAARIRAGRVYAFCSGSRLSKDQEEQKTAVPPIYQFFQNDGQKYLTRKIASYIHPIRNYCK